MSKQEILKLIAEAPESVQTRLNEMLKERNWTEVRQLLGLRKKVISSVKDWNQN